VIISIFIISEYLKYIHFATLYGFSCAWYTLFTDRGQIRINLLDMAEEFTDQQFVEDVVRSIVNHPDDVRTERTVDERGVLITLFTNPEDMGYVIGRSGQTARSIRTLLRIVGAKNNARVTLKIIEPEGSTHVRRERDDFDDAPHNEAPPVEDDIDTSTVDDLTI